jgi:hypothetical protein
MENQITTPALMFEWAQKNITGIKFLFESTQEVEKHTEIKELEQRYSVIKTIPGTRSHHCFLPVSHSELQMRRISLDVDFSTVHFQKSNASIGVPAFVQNDCLQPGRYVACMYDNKWYVGNIVERNDTEQDLLVNFMRRIDERTLSWPTRKDECYIPLSDVVCLVDVPVVMGASARLYQLSLKDFNRILELLESRHN